MPARMAGAPQSSIGVGYSILGLQTRYCSHRWDHCEEPKDRGAPKDTRVFTPEAAPSPSRSGQIYPKSQRQVVLAWYERANQEACSDLPILSGTPTRYMQILGCDIFQHASPWYSCIIDYHTGYLWVQAIRNQEADTVIQHFQSVCNQFGYPAEIVRDRELCLKFNIVHKPGTPHSQWKNGRCENAIERLKRLLEKSKEEETCMEDILLNIRDTPLDANTPSPYELMFHRKIKSDLPSIPLSLFDSTHSFNAGRRSVKHAEKTNEDENRGEPPRLEQDQTVMFMKRPQAKKARLSSGTVISVDGQRSYTVQDDATRTQYSRDRVHIKSVPRSAPISTTMNFSSEKREEASLPVETPNVTATTKPPKPKPKTPIKHSANNPSHSVETSRPRRTIKALVRYRGQ